MFGLMKLAFEMQLEKKFPMSNESLMKIMPVWEQLAAKVDKLNGIESTSLSLEP
jgi:hypothetical protein